VNALTAKATLRRFNAPLAVVAGVAAGLWYVRPLASYGVPVYLVVGYALAVFTVFRDGVSALLERLASQTYRCPAPDCGFRVRLTGTDPGESRRWQEIATAHPTHNHHR
jgi:uncharacterized membrane protein YcfT